jgi:hypothetical protein
MENDKQRHVSEYGQLQLRSLPNIRGGKNCIGLIIGLLSCSSLTAPISTELPGEYQNPDTTM